MSYIRHLMTTKREAGGAFFWRMLLGLFVTLFCSPLALSSINVQAKDGRIDLKGWQGTPSYALQGEWYFAGQELLTPEAFLEAKAQGRSFQLTTIGQSLQESDPEKIKGPLGFGTYILHLENLTGNLDLGLNEISAYVSARVYFFNDKGEGAARPVRELGFVSSDPKESRSQISNGEPVLVRSSMPGDYYILIQVANFHHAWGGLWFPPKIGLLPVILQEVTADTKANYFVFGVMIFIGFYNLMLYLFRREDKGSLYLAAICLTLLLRTWVINNFGEDFFGDGYWGVQLSFKIIYVTLFTLPWSGYRSAQDFFPKQTPRWMEKVIPRVCFLLICFVLFTPSRIFASIGNALFVCGILMGFCCWYIAARAALAKEPGSYIVIFGILSVLLGSIAEFLNTFNIIFWGRNAMTFGMTIYAASLSQIVSKRFSLAFRQAEHLSRELHNEVQQQTRDIRSLLDNLNQGIFTIVEGTQLVGSLFSGYLKRIIGRDRIEGQNLRSLLLNDCSLNSDFKDRIDAAIFTSLGEDPINFELNSDILVREVEYLHPETQATVNLELDWSPIFDQNERVEKILVSVRDVTEIRLLREEARRREEDFEILKELIDVGEDRFSRFLPNARVFLTQAQSLIALTLQPNTIQQIFVTMHSFKGVARSYNLKKLANAIHLAEETLSDIRQGKRSWDAETLERERSSVASVLDQYVRLAVEKLDWMQNVGTKHQNKLILQSTIGLIWDADAINTSMEVADKLARLEQQLLEISFPTLQQVAGEAARGLDSLARSLGKIAPHLNLDVEGVILKDATASTLHGVFSHLFRNSLDHGIESSEERQQQSKSLEGHIRLLSEMHEDHITLLYSDDGSGLDVADLKRIAQERQIPEYRTGMSDEKIAELIFLPGVSTKTRVTEISGRGVGMDAVRSLVEALGGRVCIQLGPLNALGRRNFALAIDLPAAALVRRKVRAVAPVLSQSA